MRGLAAKVAAVVVNNSASAISVVRFVLIARFRALSLIGVNPNEREIRGQKRRAVPVSRLSSLRAVNSNIKYLGRVAQKRSLGGFDDGFGRKRGDALWPIGLKRHQ